MISWRTDSQLAGEVAAWSVDVVEKWRPGNQAAECCSSAPREATAAKQHAASSSVVALPALPGAARSSIGARGNCAEIGAAAEIAAVYRAGASQGKEKSRNYRANRGVINFKTLVLAGEAR